MKPIIRKYEEKNGVLILDDSIIEKPYSKENEIVCWHYSHAKGIHLKGINFISCMIRYNDMCLPVCYKLIHKDVKYFDDKEKRWRRKSSTTKNEYFINLIKQCSANDIAFKYILADSWFSAKNNLEFIHFDQNKFFILGLRKCNNIN